LRSIDNKRLIRGRELSKVRELLEEIRFVTNVKMATMERQCYAISHAGAFSLV